MIEKKYQFFIDTRLQKDFITEKTLVKKPTSEQYQLLKNFSNLERIMICIEEVKTNTRNAFVKNFCIENNIPEQFYYKIVRSFENITIANFDLKDISELPKDLIFVNEQSRITYDYLQQLNYSEPYIIKVNHNNIFQRDESINYGSNIIISDNVLTNSKKGLDYRIYLDDRLLVERFFPIDLPYSKVLCEECFLNLTKPVKVKIETTHNLIFTKIVYNDKIEHPNTIEFILEP